MDPLTPHTFAYYEKNDEGVTLYISCLFLLLPTATLKKVHGPKLLDDDPELRRNSKREFVRNIKIEYEAVRDMKSLAPYFYEEFEVELSKKDFDHQIDDLQHLYIHVDVVPGGSIKTDRLMPKVCRTKKCGNCKAMDFSGKDCP